MLWAEGEALVIAKHPVSNESLIWQRICAPVMLAIRMSFMSLIAFILPRIPTFVPQAYELVGTNRNYKILLFAIITFSSYKHLQKRGISSETAMFVIFILAYYDLGIAFGSISIFSEIFCLPM